MVFDRTVMKSAARRAFGSRSRGCHVRPFSIPATAASETVRSTVFSVSFAVSAADFRARREVEKDALGANRRVRRVVVEVRVRKDMVQVTMKTVLKSRGVCGQVWL